MAVLYRTGAQSRSFEEVLRRLGIRHRVVGGFSFYERAEVRNALAYVRLLFHPEDDVALLRVLNVPAARHWCGDGRRSRSTRTRDR